MKIGEITNKASRYIFGTMMTVWALGVLAGCASKQDPIDDLNGLIAEVEQNYERYNDDDWSMANQSMEAILKDIDTYHLEYTDQEWQYIGELKTKYSVLYSAYTLKQLKDRGNEALQQLKGGLNSLFGE